MPLPTDKYHRPCGFSFAWRQSACSFLCVPESSPRDTNRAREEAIIASVKKTNRVLIVHEDTRTGGIAGEIAMRINEKAFEWLDAPILRVTALDAPIPYSPPLEDYFLPQVEDVVVAVRHLAAY